MRRRSLSRALVLVLGGWLCAAAARAAEPGFDLARALAEAEPGATIVVPGGVHAGPLTLSTPVTLVGDDWPIIEGTGAGDVITVDAADVTLRGFVIRKSGDRLENENAGVTGLAPRLTVEGNRLEDVLFGVYLKGAPGSIVRDNMVRGMALDVARRGDAIRLWYSAGGLVEGNHVQDSRDVVVWFSPDTVVRGNTVEGGRYGVHSMFSDDMRVEDNVLRHNSVGAFLMYGRRLSLTRNLLYGNRGPTGYGVGLKDVDDVMAWGNRSVGNRVGVYIDNSPRERDAVVEFAENVLAYNDIGMNLLPLVKRNTFTRNIFLDNGEQIAISGGGQLKDNEWWRDGQGNFWGDYAGFDADADGIGDIPYASQGLFESLLAEHPELRLYQLSPAADALDLAAEAFPVFKPRTKMTDRYPLMTPPVPPRVPGLPRAPVAGNLLASAGLLALALAVLAFGASEGDRNAGRLAASLPFPRSPRRFKVESR